MYLKRRIGLQKLSQKKSMFLFGPRQTGKSSLLKHELKDAEIIDLLDEDIYLSLHQNAKNLSNYITNPKKLIVLDEIQRIPTVLNEVHRLIENKGMRFLLTGSSARKLRKQGVNLLGGRARSRSLHGFTFGELGKYFELKKALAIGTIPSIYFSDEPWDDLKSYTSEYLKEEIVMEAATRDLGSFTRFLEIAASANGTLINYDKIASLSQVKRSTVQNYFQILRDTLIATDLPALRNIKHIQSIKTSKFYFFDLGVVNYFRKQREIFENTADYGNILESHLHHELRAFCDYESGSHSLEFWRSINGHEVDFVIDASVAIEVKSTKRVIKEDLKGLKSLRDGARLKKMILVCREKHEQKIDGIQILPVSVFLEKLWSHQII